MAGSYSSGVPFNASGYKLVYSETTTPQPESGPLASNVFNDPRGVLPAGMAPVKSLSYRVFDQTNEFIRTADDRGSAVFGLGAFVIAGRFDVLIGRSVTWTSVIAFEGKDVIDLETDGLDGGAGEIVVPHKVFKVLHAGDEKLIRTEDDTVRGRAIEEWLRPSDGNVANGVKQDSTDLPLDLKKYSAEDRGYRQTDTASNVIRYTGGKPKYVSYVAITRPIFRDVVYQKVAFASTVQIGVSGNIPIDALPQSATSHVIRYAWVNVAAAGEDPKFKWRMAESFGIKPTKPPVPTSAAAKADLSAKQLSAMALAELEQHYVYDINEQGDELTDDGNIFPPAKTPYSPVMAESKMNPSSPDYQEGFRAVIMEYDGQQSTAGSEFLHAVGLDVDRSVWVPDFSYTSPRILVEMGANAKLGVEYTAWRPMFLSLYARPKQTLLLAKTTESVVGISAVHDCCLASSSLFDIADSAAGPVGTERVFEDREWTVARKAVPESSLGRFSMGEFPYRSDGKLLLAPAPEQLPSGAQAPSTHFVTGLLLGVTNDNDGVFELRDTTSESDDPVYEMVHGQSSVAEGVDGPTLFVHTPPLSVASAKSGGGLELREMYGVKKDSEFLEKFPETASPQDPSEAQLSLVEAQKFPLQPSNISAALDCTTGWTFLALENGERVDLAYRPSAIQPMALLRDVTVRVPDDFEAGTAAEASSLPPSALPYLVVDPQTHNLFLFYAYKKNLLVKRIATELLAKEPVYQSLRRYSLESEAALVKDLHDLKASLVYDGRGGSGTDIATDLKFNKIKVVPPTAAPDAGSKLREIKQHSAFMDTSGLLYCFIQAEDRIVLRKSPDLGDSWQDVLPESFSFVPKIPSKPDAERVDGEAPYCFYDSSTNNVFLFFFYQQSLLCLKIAAEVLRGAPEDVAKILSEIKPSLLVGKVNSDITDRGISIQKSVEDIEKDKTEPPSLSPHRVAAVKTADGYYRVFYKDDEKRLRSLVSNDNGGTWATENQLTNG
jgi:hypothetical protein